MPPCMKFFLGRLKPIFQKKKRDASYSKRTELSYMHHLLLKQALHFSVYQQYIVTTFRPVSRNMFSE